MFIKLKKSRTQVSSIIIISCISLLLILPSVHSSQISSMNLTMKDNTFKSVSEKNVDMQLDNDFIYNVTYALSQLIFTAYDHNIEIPKGRYFGSKGENRAAEILAENMSDIGLYVTVERLQPRPFVSNDDIIEIIELLDCDVTINGKTIECYPAPSWIHPNAANEELNTIFNEQNLSFKKLPSNPFVYNKEYAESDEDFVFIDQDQWNDPNWSLPMVDIVKPFLDPLKSYMLFHNTNLFRIVYQTQFFAKNYPRCKGYVLYDFNENCYDMIYFSRVYSNYLPTIFINGSTGKKIMQNPDDYKMGIYMQQQYNTSVESYNVIGQINGTDPSKTIIISSLYDCWWNQGTADSAIGMAIVLGIAKYFIDHNLQPKYTMKFIAFPGEEVDFRGSNYYESMHKDEDILYVLDLNQVGFTQEYPRLTFDIVANKPGFLNDIYTVALGSNYVVRTGNSADITKILMNGIPSNSVSFSVNRPNCKCVSFFKDGGWILHHRNGLNYTEGDVFKYYNKTDTAITGELILNITKFVALDTFESQEKTDFTEDISIFDTFLAQVIDSVRSLKD